MDAKWVVSGDMGVDRSRLEEDLSSFGCMVVLKSPPTIRGRCGARSSQVDNSLKNYLLGLLGAYILEITSSLCPNFMRTDMKWPWLSVSTDISS